MITIGLHEGLDLSQGILLSVNLLVNQISFLINNWDNTLLYLLGTLLLISFTFISLLIIKLKKSQQQIAMLTQDIKVKPERTLLSYTDNKDVITSVFSEKSSDNPTREKYIQHFLSHGHHVLFAFSTQFDLKYVSPSVLNVWGNEPTEYLQNPELWIQQVHPDFIKPLLKGMNELATGQRNDFILEFKIKHKNGTWRWLLTDQVVITNEFGSPLEIIGSCIDINQSKEAELAAQKLNKELEQYKMALNISKVVTISDKNGIIKYVNPIFEKKSKYTAEEVIGKTHSIVNSGTQSKEFWSKMWDRILSGEMWMGEVQNKAKDGTHYWLHNTIVPIKNIHGEIEEFISLGMDITEKKNNEKQLELLSWAAQQGSSYKIITDQSCRIVWVNTSFETFTGYSFREVLGKRPEDILYGADTDSKTIAYIEKKINEQKGFSCEIQFYTKSGEKFWVLANMEPIRNELGEVTNFFCVLSNISEQRWMIENLERARRKAEESEKLKSAFLANMSHEIRTPMNAIMGFAELLNKPALSQEKRSEFANLIYSRSRDLLNILNDVLDVSKIESGQMKPITTEGNVQKMLDHFLQTVTTEVSHLQNKSVAVKMSNELNGNENIIITDFIRLHQILNNLISNAVKFTSEGSIEFGCKRKDSETLLFFVKDTGIGIPHDKLELIFKPFQQANISIHQKYGGTGLGLAIIEGLLKMLNGRIWVESELGKGSAFYFTIPYINADSKKTEANIELNKSEEIVSVMLLDSDIHNAQYIRDILKETQFQLTHVQNNENVLNEISKIKPQLILFNFHLFSEQDIEMIKKLRAVSPDSEVIPITSFVTAEFKNLFIRLGCKSYLSRPFTAGRLIDLLKKVMIEKSDLKTI